jgi:hypothetical protein
MAFVSPTPVLARGGVAAASATSPPPLRRRAAPPAARRCSRLVSPVTAMAGPPARSTECDTPVKQFLDRLKGLGKVRLIVTNSAGVMEAVSTWDGLFFATIPKGEYANLIEPKVNLVRAGPGVARRGEALLGAVRHGRP